MNACPSYVKINYLSVLTWLQTPSLHVVGGQCTAGWPEYKEENCVDLVGKGVSHFIDLCMCKLWRHVHMFVSFYGYIEIGYIILGIYNTCEISVP